MIISGNHHVTAIASDAQSNFHFFTQILGIRLVKKTVNQDDIQAYHMFYADDVGTAGTDITFFDFPGIQKGIHGTDEIERIGMRVASDAAIDYWEKRLTDKTIAYERLTMFNQAALYFEDADGQRYAIYSDEGLPGEPQGKPWAASPVPEAFQILGLGPMTLTVSNLEKMDHVLTTHLGFKQIQAEGKRRLYEVAPGGNGGRVIVKHLEGNRAQQGYGTVHHVAFKIKDRAMLDAWAEYFTSIQAPHSGFVDRFYFKSLYTRLYRPILFELATEGPGFIDDEESYETLGQDLALPPKLRPMKDQIKAMVRPVDTTIPEGGFPKETYE